MPNAARRALAALLVAVPLGAQPNDPDRREWEELFDGRTLNGWTAKFATHDVGVNHAATFRMRDGVIEARYDGYGGAYGEQFGHLYHDRPLSYYLVALEYRFVGELYPGAPSYTIRNSGIMVHSQDPRTMPRDRNFPISVEMQVLGDSVVKHIIEGDTVLVYARPQIAAGVVTGFDPAMLPEGRRSRAGSSHGRRRDIGWTSAACAC